MQTNNSYSPREAKHQNVIPKFLKNDNIIVGVFSNIMMDRKYDIFLSDKFAPTKNGFDLEQGLKLII